MTQSIRKYTIPLITGRYGRGDKVGEAEVEHFEDGTFTVTGRVFSEDYSGFLMSYGIFSFEAALPRIIEGGME